MKKYIFYFLVTWVGVGNCQTVSREQAELVATTHFGMLYNDTSILTQAVTPSYRDNTLCFYHVTMTNGAWCLVPSTMLVEPILMYGMSPYDTSDHPQAFVELIEWYKTQIDTITKSTNATRTIPTAWYDLLNPNRTLAPYVSGIELLNEARDEVQKWRQGKNNEGGCSPSYNQECPEIDDLSHLCIPNGIFGLDTCNCGRKPTGCAAVAMGQVMWYWQWPRESEYRQYHWERMPHKITNSTDPWEAKNIANLLRDCGDASDMRYCCFGSWTVSDNIVDALRNSFGYKYAHNYKKEDWNYGTAWNDLIRSEIDNRRPVIMYGDRNAWWDGHFFVIDGYRYENGSPLYHVNWGHGQNYNNDTYCLLHLLHEVANNNETIYSNHNRAIVGISPSYNDENILSLTYTKVPEHNKRSEYAFNRVAVPAVGDELMVSANGHFTIEAGNEVVLQPEFFAEYGCEVDIHIDETWQYHKEISLDNYSSIANYGQDYCIESKNADSWEFLVYSLSGASVMQTAGSITSNVTCIWDGSYLQNGRYFCTLVLKNSYGREYSIEYYLVVNSGREDAEVFDDFDLYNENSITQQELLQYGMVLADLYPNPTSGELTVAVEGDVQSIVVYNAMGQPVGGWRILTLTDSQISLDVTSLPSGPYMLSIRTADGKTKTAKLIKE